MPIVDVETVGDAPTVAAQALADALGDVFGSKPGTTWLRLRNLPREQYAENDASSSPPATFVSVLQHTPPVGQERRIQAKEIAAVVALATGCSSERVHVLFAPAAAGRIAFGGVLRQ